MSMEYILVLPTIAKILLLPEEINNFEQLNTNDKLYYYNVFITWLRYFGFYMSNEIAHIDNRYHEFIADRYISGENLRKESLSKIPQCSNITINGITKIIKRPNTKHVEHFCQICLEAFHEKRRIAFNKKTWNIMDPITRSFMMLHWNNPTLINKLQVKLNTSNPQKMMEYYQITHKLKKINIFEFSKIDLQEPNADQETITIFKCSQSPMITITEDTALYIEDYLEETGINIRWRLPQIEKYDGKKAKFVVILGIRWTPETVFLYKGEINGTMISNQNYRPEPNFLKQTGFDAWFIPEGQTVPYIVNKPMELNPRYLAIKNLVNGNIYRESPLIKNWNGPFQKE